jgi:signal transduction histidine kinase
MIEHDPPAGCIACALLARERAARTAAEAANHAKDDFFLTLSHELRRPLSAILAWVSLVRSGKLDEATAARALETIERNAKAEERLIDDMLDVSRMIGGKIRLALRPVRLATLVTETIETVRPAIDKGAIHVEMDARPEHGGSARAYIEEEETEMFKAAEKLGDDRLRALGALMEAGNGPQRGDKGASPPPQQRAHSHSGRYA